MKSFFNTQTFYSTDLMNSICFLSTSLHPIGGAEMQVSELAKALHGRGWRVRVVSMLPAAGQIEAELTACAIPVHSLDMKKGIADPRAILRLAKVLRRYRPTILHSHMVHANLLARVTRAVTHVPVQVSTVHSINEGGRLRELGYQMTDWLSDATTVISQSAGERYISIKAISRKKLKVLPNGVDVQRFLQDRDVRDFVRRELRLGNAFVWLAVGRLAPEKDYANLLAAFARIHPAATKDEVLLIAGDGPLRTEMEVLATRLGIAGKVKFLGFQSDIVGLLNAADAYVMSSRWEGLPTVLIEAASCGLPIVATEVGGNGEVVTHGETGLLVAMEDSEALARAMTQVREYTADQRSAAGTLGRRLAADNFSLDRVVGQWERLYLDLLHSRGINLTLPSTIPSAASVSL